MFELDINHVTIMHLLSRFQLLIIHERILKIFRDTVAQQFQDISTHGKNKDGR